jgi:tRNA dimethylallyltransferase
MLERGAVQEVESARRRYPGADMNRAGFKALGFRELGRYLDGEIGLTVATSKAQQATRNYAKRQATWFRHQLPDATFIKPDRDLMKYSKSSIAGIRHKIRNFLLTHRK